VLHAARAGRDRAADHGSDGPDRRRPLDPDALIDTLHARFRLLGRQGLVTIAIAGIEMAAWDAAAKAQDEPLVTLLGGAPRPIPAYASLRTMAPGAASEGAGDAVARGFAGVKLKVGGGSLREDLETIRAVRAAIGSGAELMIDYNQSLTVADALHRVRALDGECLAWIEEPTRPRRAGQRRRRARLPAGSSGCQPAVERAGGPPLGGQLTPRPRSAQRSAHASSGG
jgi:L-alanine-DL-glutamate epimerase-like enolase superfamily enzyme